MASPYAPGGAMGPPAGGGYQTPGVPMGSPAGGGYQTPGMPMSAAPAAGAPVPGAPVSGGPPMPGAPAPGSQPIGTPAANQGSAGTAKISAGGMSFNMPTYGGGMKVTRAKVALGVIGSIVLAAGSVGFYWFKNKYKARKGSISYSRLKLDKKAADPDRMISSLAGAASRWRRDAGFWSVNIHGIDKSGTVDFTSGGSAVITYISPSRVQSASKRRRRDSIKKYNFGARDVSHKRKYQPTRRWKNVTLPPEAACGIRQLVQGLKLGDAQKVRVSFDPQFAYGPFAPREISWRVFSDDARVAGYYSMASCAKTKDAPGGNKKS